MLTNLNGQMFMFMSEVEQFGLECDQQGTVQIYSQFELKVAWTFAICIWGLDTMQSTPQFVDPQNAP
jgi:hypothetical protein